MSASHSGIEVVSIETDEVEVFIGPRRISGLVSNTTELENEARAARVYRKPAQTALIFNFALGEGEQA